MASQYQHANVRAPRRGAAGSNSDVRLFTAIATHKCDAIPDNWRGKFVDLYMVGGNLWYLFTTDATAAVDRAIAASDAGTADPNLGAILPGGQAVRVRVPFGDRDGTVYFAREADAAGCTVTMRLASD